MLAWIAMGRPYYRAGVMPDGDETAVSPRGLIRTPPS